jgi:hypothetical protein
MDVAILASLIGVGGVIVGVVLAWGFDKRKQARERRDIRRVLRWENDYNLKALEDFWRKVTLEPPPQRQPAETDFEKRARLARGFLQPWGHAMWQSEAPRLSAVLNHQEFAEPYELHTGLDRFVARRAELQNLLFDTQLGAAADGAFSNRQEQMQAQVQVEIAQLEAAQVILRQFNARTQEMWNECQHIYATCQQRGNPIGDDMRHAGMIHRVRGLFGGMPKPKVSWEKAKQGAVSQ